AVHQIASQTRPIVIFLGAGFAASSRLPLGNPLRDGAIKRLLGMAAGSTHTSKELAKRFHRWLSEKPGWMSESESALKEEEFTESLTLEQVMRAEARVYPDLPTLQEFKVLQDAAILAPGPSMRLLAEIVNRGTGRIILVE